MPIYEYACDSCGKLNEVIQKVSDPAPEKCDGCGAPGKMSRIVSRTSFVLKGGGWYSDLYSSTKKGESSGTGSSAPAKTEPKKTEASSSSAPAATASSAPAATASK